MGKDDDSTSRLTNLVFGTPSHTTPGHAEPDVAWDKTRHNRTAEPFLVQLCAAQASLPALYEATGPPSGAPGAIVS